MLKSPWFKKSALAIASIAGLLSYEANAQASTAQISCLPPASFQNQLRSHPDSKAHAALGAWFAERSQFHCAAQEFKSATNLDPQSSRLAFLLGNSLFAGGDSSGAETALRRALTLAPDSADAHAKLAEVLDASNRADAAKSEWEEALRHDGKSVAALHGLAQHLMSEGNYSAAINLLQGAQDATLQLDLAEAYGKAGSVPEAETVLRKAVAENPSSFILLRALIGILVDQRAYQRDFQEPVNLAENFASTHPDDLEPQKLLLRLLVAWIPQGGQAADLSRAAPLARKLLASHPQDSYLLYANGMLEEQSGGYAAARAHLEKSLAIDPNYDQAHYTLGMVLAALKDEAGAAREFQQAIKLGDQRPEVRFQLAKALRSLGNTEAANQQFKLYSDQMAAASNLRISKLKETQADNELAQGHAPQAVASYREAVTANPDDAMLQFKLATALDKAGDAAAEKTALEKALQLDPALAVAQNQIGYLASRSGDTAAAEEHFRQAVRAAPAYAEAWINLAATLGMESKISEARQAVASALKADPNNAQALQLQQELSASEH